MNLLVHPRTLLLNRPGELRLELGLFGAQIGVPGSDELEKGGN